MHCAYAMEEKGPEEKSYVPNQGDERHHDAENPVNIATMQSWTLTNHGDDTCPKGEGKCDNCNEITSDPDIKECPRSACRGKLSATKHYSAHIEAYPKCNKCGIAGKVTELPGPVTCDCGGEFQKIKHYASLELTFYPKERYNVPEDVWRLHLTNFTRYSSADRPLVLSDVGTFIDSTMSFKLKGESGPCDNPGCTYGYGSYGNGGKCGRCYGTCKNPNVPELPWTLKPNH